MMTNPREREKAAFLSAYRALCKAHGLMVIRVENPGEYWAFSVAALDDPVLDGAIQEMLIEPVRTISLDE